MVKIGCTAGCPRARLKQVERLSGYRAFAPFRLAGAFPATNARNAEARAHRRLRPHRIWLSRTGRQELFRVDTQRALNIARMEAALRPAPQRTGGARSWRRNAVSVAMAMSAGLGLLAAMAALW